MVYVCNDLSRCEVTLILEKEMPNKCGKTKNCLSTTLFLQNKSCGIPNAAEIFELLVTGWFMNKNKFSSFPSPTHSAGVWVCVCACACVRARARVWPLCSHV